METHSSVLAWRIPGTGEPGECSNYHTVALISHTSKVMLKILQASLQQYMNRELPDVEAGFRKGRGTRDQIANIHWIIGKTREFQNICFCFTNYNKSFDCDCIDHNKLKILQKMEIPDHLTCLWETYMQIKKQQLESDMEQWTGSKLGKEYIKAVYCHPAYKLNKQDDNIQRDLLWFYTILKFV